MKKYISVFGLMAKLSLYKFIIILIGNAVFSVIAFIIAINTIDLSSMPYFDFIIQKSLIPFIFCVTFLSAIITLCISGTEYRSKVSYTVNRLSITEKSVFLCQALYNFIAILFLLSAEILTVYALNIIFCSKLPESLSSDIGILISSYRSEFLHSLLPLSSTPLWIRNLLFIFALSLSSALFSFEQRRKKISYTVIVTTIYTVLFFTTGIGISNLIITMIFLTVIIIHTIKTVKSEALQYEA